MSSTERRYRPPTHVSMTLPQYQKFINPPNLTSSPLRDIPEPHDLFNIKEDLENMVNEPETRAQRLQRDLAHLLENVKVHEKEQPPKRAMTGGKNMNVVMERMRKQERALADEAQENGFRQNASRLSKSQLERHAALEALRKRRRRDDTDDEQAPSDFKPKSSSPSIDVNAKLSNYQQEIRKKKSSGDTVQNGKRRQHYHNNNQHTNDHHHHHHTKKQKNGTTVDDDLDLVRVKPNNQVPIANFWTAMEPYFRPITEDDRKYLMEKSTPIQEDSAALLEIPPLGQFYLDKWEEEEQIMLVEDTSLSTSSSPSLSSSSSARRSRYPSTSSSSGTIPAIATATTIEEINANNNTVTTSKSALHDTAGNTLLGRLMSSLILEPMDIDTYSEDEEDDYDSQTDQSNTDDDEEIDDKVITEVECVNTDLPMHEDDDEIVGMEERLKRELQYVGLLSEGGLGDDDDEEESDWHAREDDEISAQLRRLGKELQEQIKVNEFRKERLLQVVDTQLQYDQYRQVLDVLDVQVEQSYLKRFRVQKAKKRKSGSSSKTALSEHTLAAMEKRNMCINELGAIFKEKNCVLPRKSIYDEDVLTV